MRFVATSISGVFLVELDRMEDERGFFARTLSRQDFTNRGLEVNLLECSTSLNYRRGTLRGMHYQQKPHGETKLVRCTSGSIFDVVVDVRRDSPTYCSWSGAELTAANRKMIYVPEGVAHGFLTLSDGAEIFYQISHPYVPEAGRGVRWNDPAFGISWPEEVRVISARDRTWPLLAHR